MKLRLKAMIKARIKVKADKTIAVEPWSHFAGPWGVYNLPITPSSKLDTFLLHHTYFY